MWVRLLILAWENQYIARSRSFIQRPLRFFLNQAGSDKLTILIVPMLMFRWLPFYSKESSAF